MAKDLAGFKARNTGDSIGRDGLAAEAALGLGVSKARVRGVLDQLLLTIQDALESGKRVELRGFATLMAHRSNSRRCHVPSKGRVVKVDARWKVALKTSKELKLSLMEHLEA